MREIVLYIILPVIAGLIPAVFAFRSASRDLELWVSDVELLVYLLFGITGAHIVSLINGVWKPAEINGIPYYGPQSAMITETCSLFSSSTPEHIQRGWPLSWWGVKGCVADIFAIYSFSINTILWVFATTVLLACIAAIVEWVSDETKVPRVTVHIAIPISFAVLFLIIYVSSLLPRVSLL